MNKFPRFLLAMAALMLAGGCTSTPASRIPNHQAAYNAWPAEVQREVSAGRIAVGYLPEMVRVALGEPDGVFTVVDIANGPVETWSYLDHSPSWSIGVGVGGGNGSTSIGTGVGFSSRNWGPNEKTRVVFEHGRVVAIQVRQK
jgi:hypothetical protein